MIDTEPGLPAFAVQRFVPSKAMEKELTPRLLVATVTAPGDCVGSMTYRPPGMASATTKTLPAATTIPKLSKASVHVPNTFPVLACIWTTSLPATVQMSSPSAAQNCGD